ncbi:MAG: hypothetical protein M5U26_07085 [Planctomycetota bacterium]|nr:hypothetical protein [Planctomycetota bacterium]
MKFYFCEKCGKRLTEKDIDAGSARDKKLRGVFCSDCAAGVLTMESLPLTEEQAQQLIAQDAPKQDGGKRASGAHPVRRTGAHAPVRGSARGATTTAQGPIRATGATTARGAARGPAPQSSPTMLYVGGGGGPWRCWSSACCSSPAASPRHPQRRPTRSA